MKVYRYHDCDRMHRTYMTVARCVWPKALWIKGNEHGRFALVSWCRGWRPTVTLHDSAPAAFTAKQHIDELGCGGRCVGKHELVELAQTVSSSPTPY